MRFHLKACLLCVLIGSVSMYAWADFTPTKPYYYLQEPSDGLFAVPVHSFENLQGLGLTTYVADSFILDHTTALIGVSWWGTGWQLQDELANGAPTLDFVLRFWEQDEVTGGPGTLLHEIHALDVAAVLESEFGTPGVFRWQYYFDHTFQGDTTYFFSAAQNAADADAVFLWWTSDGTPDAHLSPAWRYTSGFGPFSDGWHDTIFPGTAAPTNPEHMAFGLIIPEPTTITILGIGLGGLAAWRRKDRRRKT